MPCTPTKLVYWSFILNTVLQGGMLGKQVDHKGSGLSFGLTTDGFLDLHHD